jgi:hypothetical protein
LIDLYTGKGLTVVVMVMMMWCGSVGLNNYLLALAKGGGG